MSLSFAIQSKPSTVFMTFALLHVSLFAERVLNTRWRACCYVQNSLKDDGFLLMLVKCLRFLSPSFDAKSLTHDRFELSSETTKSEPYVLSAFTNKIILDFKPAIKMKGCFFKNGLSAGLDTTLSSSLGGGGDGG